MKKVICLVLALAMLLGVGCAEAQSYVLGPFSFGAPVQLAQGATALQLEGEGVEVELSNLPAMSLPRAYAEMLEPADLAAMVQELDKMTFEDVEPFELENGVYGAIYTDGENRVGHYVCGLDMLYVTGPAGEVTEAVLEAVTASIAHDADAEPVRVELELGSMSIAVPEDWYVCSITESMIEFAPPTGSVGVQLTSAEQLDMDQATVDSMGVDAASKAACDKMIEEFGDAEYFTTEAGLHAVRCWREVGEDASVLTVFVVNGMDVLVLIASANAGTAVMEDLAEQCLGAIAVR